MAVDVIDKAGDNGTKSDINKTGTTKSRSGLAKDQVQLTQIMGNEMLTNFGFENLDSVFEDGQTIFPNTQAESYQWYSFVIDYIPSIFAALRTRYNAVIQTPYEFIIDDEKGQGLKALELIKWLFSKQLNLSYFISDLLTAIPMGFSVIESNWAIGKDNLFLPYQLHKKDNIHFKFGIEQNNIVLRWIDKSGGDPTKGEKLNQNKFIIHQHNANYENPYGKSELSFRVFWLSKIILESLNAMVRFQDGYGKPYTIIKLTETLWKDKTSRAIADKLVEKLYKTAGMVLQEGMNTELVQARSSQNSMFLDTIRYCDNQITLDILGQSTTSDDSNTGSLAKSQVASKISQTIVNADIVELSETINNFSKQICDYNFTGLETYPYIKFKVEPEEDTDKRMTYFKTAFDMGMSIPKQSVAKMLDIPYSEDTPEEELLIQSSTFNQSALPFSQSNQKKNDNFLEFSKKYEEIGKAEWELIDRWYEEAIIPITAGFKPIYNDIINYAKTLTQKTLKDIKKFTPTPKQFDRMSNLYFNYLGWIDLYGMSAMYRDSGEGLSFSAKEQGLLYFAQKPLEFREIAINYDMEQMPYNEAIDYFSNQTPMLVDDMIALEKPLRAKAFWLAKSDNIEATNRVYNFINQGIVEGQGVDEFISLNRDALNRLGFIETNDIRASYMRMAYRTNQGLALQSGRYQTSQNRMVRNLMPYQMYIAIMDDRVRPNHAMYNGMVYANNDPIWNVIYPPNGYQCRCTTVMLSSAQIQRYGYTIQNKNQYQYLDDVKMVPDKGWNSNQAKNWLKYRG